MLEVFHAIWPFRIEDILCQFDPIDATLINCYYNKYIQFVLDIIVLWVIPSVLTHPRRTKVSNDTFRQSQFSSPDENLHRYLLRFIPFSKFNL
jgi:hypothetical protein